VPLNLEDKKALVKEVAEIASSAQSVVAAEYRGITVSQMTELRAKARAQGVYMRVVKNTLARKALVGTSFEAVGPQLKGPLVLAFSKDDPGAAARVVKDFSKANDKLVCDARVLGWRCAARQGSRESRIAADARTGSVDAVGYAQSTDREIRSHGGCAAHQAGPHGRGCPRREAGRQRLNLLPLKLLWSYHNGC